jgi:hypothetical protein
MESPELVETTVKNMINREADPKWELSGASSAEEYEGWTLHICGIACLKMILKAELDLELKTLQLVHLAQSYNCLDKEKGIYYHPFCEMVEKEFNLKASFDTALTLEQIQAELCNRHYVMASVHGSIREENLTVPASKGGHLVLITGFNRRNKALTIHDPSGYYGRTQENRVISEANFADFSANRGIIIHSKTLN